MTKTESAEHIVKTLAIESCEQWLQCGMAEGVRATVQNTNNLIMVGPQEWIAKNVPGVEAMVAAAEPKLGEDDIIAIWQTMPGGPGGWLKSFGFLQFARAIEAEVIDRLAATTQASTAPHDAGDARKVWDAALSHAALYVEAHCVDGETHAAAIMSSARPSFAAVASQASTAQADPGELEKMRAQVQQLETMLEDRVERKPNNEQEWTKIDGAVAFHLIERHADNWHDAGNMMESWARTRVADTSSTDAQAAAEVSTDAARDMLAERRRQVEAEGWTPEHDDAHNDGAMVVAAACYALQGDAVDAVPPEAWPWAMKWWKPSGARRNLIKAGALILAEIERIDRAELRSAGDTGGAQ